MKDEQTSKDRFFMRAGVLADEMIAAHGKDFAMGVLVLAARWVAEGKSFTVPSDETKAH
ncbi:MAG TPA: hypothetical protein PLI12_04555 [Acetobacteraceae bacterium]|nr:hypothetical protein [Acetobacteraceae bacterium]HQU01701.1 hypothetical protein [Acetobacteraceae bacterium]